MLTLTRLVLTDFRNHPALNWRPEGRISVLTGPNGAGKTNLLEAITLLGPGRGLGRARLAEMARQGGPGTWTISGRLQRAGQQTDIGTGLLAPGSDRRAFRLDGAEPRTQADIAAHLATIWLTPQMDSLFAESATGRRRFLDRLVWALEPGHAREATALETAMAERRRVLETAREKGRGPDPAWLSGLEDSIARHATALSAARAAFTTRLNAAAARDSGFPHVRLALEDPIATRLANTPALAVEDWLRAELAARRAADAAAGTSTLGAHRADMRLHDAATGLDAAHASTGQRRAMLTGLILAHAALITQARGFAPLLLLDEPAVHLDEQRRAALWHELIGLEAQVFLTGTDVAPFAALKGHAEFLNVQPGEVSKNVLF